MCPPKAPKIPKAVVAAPAGAPPEQVQLKPELNVDSKRGSDISRSKRRGRSALRIDLATSAPVGASGANIPQV